MKARARAALQLELPNSFPCKTLEQSACPPSKFRAPTAECNNIINRHWGARGDTLLRLLPSNYADKHSQPRSSIGSHALPEPDVIVEALQKSINSKLAHPHITGW